MKTKENLLPRGWGWGLVFIERFVELDERRTCFFLLSHFYRWKPRTFLEYKKKMLFEILFFSFSAHLSSHLSVFFAFFFFQKKKGTIFNLCDFFADIAPATSR